MIIGVSIRMQSNKNMREKDKQATTHDSTQVQKHAMGGPGRQSHDGTKLQSDHAIVYADTQLSM